LGRTIRATANHKFRTFAGWKRLDELRTGERLALPREVPSPYGQTMSDAELALLGHLIGDGCTLPRHVIQYTTREKDLAELVSILATRVFGAEVMPRINREHNWYQVYLASTRHHTHKVRSARIARVVDSDLLGRLSHSDLYWDEISAIDIAGEAEVYDLTVDGLHNFIVNDIVAHNSIEQDADVVCFIYREEVYSQSDENRGIAELIVGKQRNGPTGAVQLAFLKEFTRFENMWKE
jgi:replicative DNA helicase